jgi:hypothetical protein
MIVQKAQQTYARIPEENKRYIDFEDVLQEGLIAAWKAEQSFNPKKSKYSTYVFNGLDQINSGLLAPFRQAKRNATTGLVELDAPVEGTQNARLDIEDVEALPSEIQEAVDVLLVVFWAADSKVQQMMLEVASGKLRFHPRYLKLARRLRKLVRLHQASERHFNLLCSNQDVKAQVIEGMARLTNIEATDARLLLCGECGKLFSLTDVRQGRYVASSLACSECLTKMQGRSVNSTCFGKAKVVQDGRVLRQGFSESNAACRLHCRDRVACKIYAAKRGRHMTGEQAVLDGFEVGDVVIPEDVEKAVPTKKAKAPKKAGLKLVDKGKAKAAGSGKTVKAKVKKVAKTEKSAKAVKTVKKAKKAAAPERKPRTKKSAAKIDPHSERGRELVKANLDDKGRDLPFKNPSNLRKMFVYALKTGRTLAEMNAKAKSLDLKSGDPTFQLAVLRSLKSGESSLRPYPTTHVWKLTEDAGQFHIHGVKRIACYERMARLDGR